MIEPTKPRISSLISRAFAPPPKPRTKPERAAKPLRLNGQPLQLEPNPRSLLAPAWLDSKRYPTKLTESAS